jgi:predicted DCC family thiol-disulfide oxidoreductase YuxK
MTQQRPTLMLHDGACALCRIETTHYARHADPLRLQLVDVHCAEGSSLLRQIGVAPEAALRRLHVITPKGTIVTGARAFIAVWEAMGWHRLACFAALPGIRQVVEGAYRLFVPLRKPLSNWLARRIEDRAS